MEIIWHAFLCIGFGVLLGNLDKVEIIVKFIKEMLEQLEEKENYNDY